jgi:toxin ParE1/3/4
MVIIWTLPAKYDLRDIHEYISKESTFYAHKVIDTIIESVDPLIEFPKMGKIVPEINEPNIREILVYSYRVIYEIVGEEIQVTTVIHARRDFEKAYQNH